MDESVKLVREIQVESEPGLQPLDCLFNPVRTASFNGEFDKLAKRHGSRLYFRNTVRGKQRSQPFVDFLVERLNFDADYMQVLCSEKLACEASMAEVAMRQAVVDEGPREPLPA